MFGGTASIKAAMKKPKSGTDNMKIKKLAATLIVSKTKRLF